MAVAPRPLNEAARLRALRDYRILDTEAEPSFDRITALVSRILDVPISIVGLIDEERQWFKSCVGLEGPDVSRDVSFCSYALVQSDLLVIADARLDPRFAENPFVTGPPFVRAYAGAQLRTPDGLSLGTLCALDPRPRVFTPEQLSTLSDLAAIVVDEMELRRQTRNLKVYEQIAKVSPNVVFVQDLVTNVVSWKSRAMTAELGFELDELSLTALSSHMPPEDALRAIQNIQRASDLPDSETFQTTYRVHDDGGRERHMLVRSAPFTRDLAGALTELLSVVTDVTQLKLAEQRVADSEALLASRVEVLEAILEAAGEGILVADEHAQVIVANSVARDVTGRLPGSSVSIEREPTLLNNYYEPDGETTFDREKLPLRNALRGIATNNVEMMVRNERYPDGKYLSLTGRPVRDRAGVVRGGVVTLSDVTALRIAQRRLVELAVTDELTNLPNRRALRERLELVSAEASRGRSFSVAIADIDHFKSVNDTHGHAEGDRVLVAVARTLRECVRRGDMVARMGGEEFCVILTDLDVERMTMLTERLRAAVERASAPISVTASFGVCHSSTTADPTELLHRADRALYEAKRAGRNRVQIAT